MIGPDHARLMARYNAWQNRSLYGAAEGIGEAERRRERGAFFGTIHGTLSHLAWGDQAWLSRFTGSPAPTVAIKDSPRAFDDWDALKTERARLDAAIAAFAETVAPDWLAADLVWWSASAGREVAKPRWVLVTHMFNHQTHHRGQVHAMLTAAGARPEATDIPFMPEG